MLSSAVRLSFCRFWHRWMRRLLCHDSRVRTLLRSGALLWRRAQLRRCGRRYSRGWRPGVLYSRPWLLRRPHLLRLEAWTLEMAERSESLDPWPLRSEIIEPRAAGFLASLQAFRNSRSLNDRRSQPPACQTKTHSRGEAA